MTHQMQLDRVKLFKIRALVFALTVGPMTTQSVNAATRTVQFAGVAVNDPATMEVGNFSVNTSCVIAVTNLSAQRQRITGFKYYNYSFSSDPKTLSSISSTSSKSWKGNSGTPKTCVVSATATGEQDGDLQSGQTCFLRYPVQAVIWSGRIAPCMGSITVSDVDATKPGSVIASGALYLNQESMVLGGQLSGAYYASQTHVRAGDFAASGGKLEDPPTGVAATDAQNMNIFCEAACKAHSASNDGCAEHCGVGKSGSDYGWYYHVAGWDRVSNNVGFQSGYTGDTTASTYPAVSSVNDPDRMRYHGVTNTHYAGGMVYEMQIGSFGAICSANKQYFQDGGFEFAHADGVDSHAVYSSNSDYPNAPPERLVCAHRHGKQDLFMRVGSTSPIVVNGGMPF